MSAEAMVIGSLLGDAISLGPHWIYEPEEIAAKIGRPVKFHDPISKYHPGKTAGDLTHYGDRLLVVLRHLAKAKEFGIEGFAADWKAYWEDPATIAYRDSATRGTLENLQKGVPVTEAAVASHDIAGAGVIAPLFLLEWPDKTDLVATCRALAGFSHRDANVIGAAEFFALICVEILEGDSVARAMEEVSGELAEVRFQETDLHRWWTAAKGSARSTETDGTVLAEHGLSCNVDGAFANVCHLLLKYPEDPFTALVENAAAGGDSAARGLLLGMVYGAAGLTDRLPAEWIGDLKSAAEVKALCADLTV